VIPETRYVRTADGAAVGSGAGTYAQNPLGAMLELAFANVGESAAVTLTYLASAMVDRAKTHGDITMGAEPSGGAWSWSVADDAHDVVALGEKPSRGAALLAAEAAMASHLGIAIEGYGQGTLPPPPPAVPHAHGVAFPGCTVRVANEAEWMQWARARVKDAFDEASGLPTPDALLDATVGVAMADAGHEGCEIDELVLGTKPWADAEVEIVALLAALESGAFLAIPGPDELLASIMVGIVADNRGAKEAYGEWSIVVRPADGAPAAAAFRWWAWHGPRLLDTDADFAGVAASEVEGLARAKVEIDAAPAVVGLEGA